MIGILLVASLLCFLSGLLNSTEDLHKDKYYESIFVKMKGKWFAPDSWRNKYVGGDSLLGRTRFKFLGFSFIKPVQFTDWWHFSKMLNLTFLFTSMFLFSYLEMNWQTFFFAVFCGCLRNLGFMLGYTKLFYRK